MEAAGFVCGNRIERHHLPVRRLAAEGEMAQKDAHCGTGIGGKMMEGRRKRGRGVRALSASLAALLCALTAGPGAAYGATDIDTARTDCRIDFTLDVDTLNRNGETGYLETASPDYDQYYGELAEYLSGGGDSGAEDGPGPDSSPRAIQVNLYRIAEVDEGGRYKLLADYAASEGLSGLEAADADTTAQQWAGWAASAAQRAVGTVGEDGILEPPAGGQLQPDGSAEIALQDGKAAGAVENLSVGLYLVDVEPVVTDGCRYSFIPYLISLPNRSYRAQDAEGQEADEWIYGNEEGKRIYVGLKPEREDRYGDLILEKRIRDYSETFRGASFVFEIKAVRDDRVVYNDVVSLDFDSYGTESVRIEKLPVGAEVTVTEVYSGANYVPADGNNVKSAVIAAGEETVKVSFENEYKGTNNGGNASVVNHFVYGKDEAGQENLQWEKLEGGADR